jgi:hypothetical protein
VLRVWRIRDYGDLCRYFLKRRHEICVGVGVTRRVVGPVEKRRRNLSAGAPESEPAHRPSHWYSGLHRHHPSEHWRFAHVCVFGSLHDYAGRVVALIPRCRCTLGQHREASDSSVFVIMPNPDDEMPIRPGDHVYVLQRKHDYDRVQNGKLGAAG